MSTLSSSSNRNLGVKWVKPVSVVIPVYHGTPSFQKLIASLEQSYPEQTYPNTDQPDLGARAELEFVVLDDGSTDPLLHEFYETAPFFKRKDVILKRRKRNLGFVQTVNEAVTYTRSEADLVLLNSDTEVWSRSFEGLQEVAYRSARVGTVTPLSHQATIANLFHWPEGVAESPFPPREIAETVNELRVATPEFGAPTGVGFCLYIKRQVWNEVGEFSEEFGKGYGEECDWCQRAVRGGWIHLICTETYVHHQGSASFQTEEKKSLIKRNSALVEKRNPGYHASVGRYVRTRPLKVEISFLIAHLGVKRARKENPKAKAVLLVLHSDPTGPKAGGTEKHVQRLTEDLSPGHPVFTIWIEKHNIAKLRLNLGGKVLLEEFFHVEILASFLESITPILDVLHVHHLLNWPESMVDRMVRLQIPRKIMSIHDYYSICPSVNLLKGKKVFCEVEKNLVECNRCLKKTYGFWNLNISSYRLISQALLENFQRVWIPSPTLEEYYRRAFPTGRFKMEVFEHDLAYLTKVKRPVFKAGAERARPRKIAVIGTLVPHKGSQLVVESLDELQRQGWSVEIWGSFEDQGEKIVREKTQVFPFHGIVELIDLFETRQPDLVVLPSITAETFSFMFYEAILLGEVPVIVGPFGHPAYMAKKEGLGVAMADASAKSLITACAEARDAYDSCSATVKSFVQRWRAIQPEQKPYLEIYLEKIESLEKAKNSADPRVKVGSLVEQRLSFPQVSQSLSVIDARLQLQEQAFARVALWFQEKLMAFPQLERAVVRVLKLIKGWIFQIRDFVLLVKLKKKKYKNSN